MTEPATLTHVEVHFIHGEPLVFTLDSARDVTDSTEDALQWLLTHEDGTTERIVVDPKQVRYTRALQRPVVEDEDAKVASLVNGDHA
jgi:hypothetical protein